MLRRGRSSLLTQAVTTLALAMLAVYQTATGHFVAQLVTLAATGAGLLRIQVLLRRLR